MALFYNIGILLYQFGIFIASFFNEKAKLFREGRKGVFDILKSKIEPNDKYVWVHAASLGEFEQGRPIIEKIKREKPEYKVILTFFSPSGYEVRKNYDQADIVCYLPMDTVWNAKKFVSIVNPSQVIFVKYEFWMSYINALFYKQIPTYVVSAIFRPEQLFFKWYGFWYRPVLRKLNHLYVQNNSSVQLLKKIGVNNVTVVGDTRFDRVLEIKKTAPELPVIATFKGDNRILIAGSSWEPDEELLIDYFNTHTGFKMILAPHVTSEDHIVSIVSKLKRKTARYTKDTPEDIANADCLIIDCIGILTSVYKYGDVAYVGGGFGVGIHNVLEPAVFGMPVFFGPNYKKFREAVEMVKVGAAFPISSRNDLFPLLDEMFNEHLSTYQSAANESRHFVSMNTGATDIVFNDIFK